MSRTLFLHFYYAATQNVIVTDRTTNDPNYESNTAFENMISMSIQWTDITTVSVVKELH